MPRQLRYTLFLTHTRWRKKKGERENNNNNIKNVEKQTRERGGRERGGVGEGGGSLWNRFLIRFLKFISRFKNILEISMNVPPSGTLI